MDKKEVRAKRVFEIKRREDENEIQFYVLDNKGNVMIQGDEVRITVWLRDNLK